MNGDLEIRNPRGIELQYGNVQRDWLICRMETDTLEEISYKCKFPIQVVEALLEYFSIRKVNFNNIKPGRPRLNERGTRLSVYRMAHGHTQQDLANILHKSPSSVSRAETSYKEYSQDTWDNIAELYYTTKCILSRNCDPEMGPYQKVN